MDFHNFLDSMNPSITFTLSSSTTSINFFDTEVVLTEGQLLSRLYVKPTDKNTILRYESAYPQRMINSLPYSQLLCVKKIVNIETAVDESIDTMGHKFLKRGYPKSLVNTQINKVKLMKPEDLVQKREADTFKRIPFISTHGKSSPKITGIIDRHWPIMSNSFPKITVFQTRPLMSYRKPQNLKDHLLKTCVPGSNPGTQRVLRKLRPGHYPCLNCISCGLMHKGDIFIHPKTKESFKIRQYMTCTTALVPLSEFVCR